MQLLETTVSALANDMVLLVLIYNWDY